MLFSRHPRLMNDIELCNWVTSLVSRKTPESYYLDYKASISINKRNEKIELCKDITSFANEGGGVLLYGIPEEDENGVPVPKDFSECGIEIPKDLPISIENIIMDIVCPPLPELLIKILALNKPAPKSLLLIYHPESWNKPHMVEGYEQGRYYHRGNYRAILMNEKQIEAAYVTRKASLDFADNFFRTGNFRDFPSHGIFFRAIVCARFSLFRREEMAEDAFKKWLDNNPPDNRRGDWIPFIDGWCFRGYPKGNFYGKQYEIRLFHNGSICLNLDLSSEINEGYLNLTRMEEYIFNKLFLPYAYKALESHKIAGPIFFSFELFNAKNLMAKYLSEKWYSDPDVGDTPIETNTLSFVEESSVNKLRFSSEKVQKRLVDRLSSAFGIWRK